MFFSESSYFSSPSVCFQSKMFTTCLTLTPMAHRQAGCPRSRLPHKADSSRHSVVANNHISLDAFIGAIHIHRQSERHHRGPRQLNAHHLRAVDLTNAVSV